MRATVESLAERAERPTHSTCFPAARLGSLASFAPVRPEHAVLRVGYNWNHGSPAIFLRKSVRHPLELKMLHCGSPIRLFFLPLYALYAANGLSRGQARRLQDKRSILRPFAVLSALTGRSSKGGHQPSATCFSRSRPYRESSWGVVLAGIAKIGINQYKTRSSFYGRFRDHRQSSLCSPTIRVDHGSGIYGLKVSMPL
jgi:hypothetical protein